MYRNFLLSILLLSSGLVHGQITTSDTLIVPTRHFQIGLNMTRALAGLTGNSSFTEDPYLLTFRFGSARRHTRFGINFRVKNKTETTFNGKLTLKESAFNFRGGYEWAFPVSRRWDLYWGIDGVLENVHTKVKSTGFVGASTLESTVWGFGAGPVIGFAWHIHPRVSLSTECSIYAMAHRGKENVVAFTDYAQEPVHEFAWQPLLPTSLFVNFSF